MYLKSLEILGFKSFAKKGTLEFTTPVCGIVGPNGSGKSNVAEAFRFVLGEQSIKSLRGKKGEDLIFNGSNEIPRMSRASVKIVFDNTKKLFNVDFDEVSLERVVYRDSQNEYFINGSPVRLKDVVELLSSANIGHSGYNIISQGETDKILNANLKDRKSMIEDALGLKIYHYKKGESEKKLEKTEENIKEVMSLRREIAPHLKFLKRQVQKIEGVMQMREDLKVLYREYLKIESEYISYQKNLINKERFPLKIELKDLDKQMEKARDVLSNSSSADLKSEKVIFLEKEMGRVRVEKDEVIRKIGRIEGEISSIKRLIEKQKLDEESRENSTILTKKISSFFESLKQNLENILHMGDFKEINLVVSDIKKSLDDFLLENSDSVSVSDFKYYDELKELEVKKESLNLEYSNFEKEELDFKEEYSDIQFEIEKEKDSSREAEKEIFKIKALQNEIWSKINEINGIESRLRVEEEDFKREITEASVLIGQSALDFRNHSILIEDLIKEPRRVQEERRREIEKIKIRLEDSGIGSEDEILKEYEEVSQRDKFLESELVDLEKSSESLKQLIKDLSDRLDIEFKKGVDKINRQFQEFFSVMFNGGQASLKVVKEVKRKRQNEFSELEEGIIPEEETEEGIDIYVNLPRKKIKGLIMLSGGERALTSIALLFAISQVNPPPFLVLDETDAALDESNSKKYGDMIESLSKYSQLIVITHNRETMSRAGVLYGVTMVSGGVSRMLSVQFEEAVAVAK